jgi:hypothetical protein
MIDPLSKLTVLHDDNGSFSNHTENAADYLRDTFNMSLHATEDYLYLGYMKPFNSAFLAFAAANINANTLTAQYYDGSSWVSLDLTDESKGMTRDGFLFWNKELMKATTISGINKFYIRLRPSATHSATVVKGINLIFADDNALKQEFFEADHQDLLPPGETSHLVNHVGARNSLLQMLRNKGYIKQTDGSTQQQNITQWDLMDLFETKQAAVMLTLSKIFFMLSDSQEDTWWAKYKEYQDKFEESFQLVLLAIDSNNNGLTEVQEANEPFRVQRWLR